MILVSVRFPDSTIRLYQIDTKKLHNNKKPNPAPKRETGFGLFWLGAGMGTRCRFAKGNSQGRNSIEPELPNLPPAGWIEMFESPAVFNNRDTPKGYA